MSITSSSYVPPSTHPFRMLAVLLACLPFLTLPFSDHHGLVSALNLLAGLVMVVTLAWGPAALVDIVARPGKEYWWNHEATWTVVLLFLLSLLGSLAGFFGTLFGVVLAGVAATKVERRPLGQSGTWLSILGLCFLGVFCYLNLYGIGLQHYFFTETTALGEGLLDTPYHASIAEIFQAQGVPSSGFHGAPRIHYHWLSHLLMGGLARFTGVDSFSFYHLFYPALFIPLLLKVLYLFTHRLTHLYGLPLRHLLTSFIVGLFFLYALPLQVLQKVHPFSGESLTLSFLLVFTHALSLVQYSELKSKVRRWGWLILYSAIFGLLISFSKISTGFAWLGGLAPLFLLKVPAKKWFWAVPVFLLIAVLTYLYILPSGRSGIVITIVERVNNILPPTGGFVRIFWLPLLLLIWFSSARNRRVLPKSWSPRQLNYLLDGRSAPFLVLVVAWCLGVLGGVATSAVEPDAMLFFSIVLFISLPLYLLLAHAFLNRFHGTAYALLVAVLPVLCFLSTPKTVAGLMEARRDLVNVQSDDIQVKRRSALIRELGNLREYPDKHNAAIYIPPAEDDWLRTGTKLSLHFSSLVPAITGIPLVDGIPAEVINSDFNSHSVATYRKGSLYPPSNDIEVTRTHLRELGRDDLIVIRSSGEGVQVKKE